MPGQRSSELYKIKPHSFTSSSTCGHFYFSGLKISKRFKHFFRFITGTMSNIFSFLKKNRPGNFREKTTTTNHWNLFSVSYSRWNNGIKWRTGEETEVTVSSNVNTELTVWRNNVGKLQQPHRPSAWPGLMGGVRAFVVQGFRQSGDSVLGFYCALS